MDVQNQEWSSDAQGFSLVGLLMVIVVLGALTATAVVGVSTLTGGSGSSGSGSTAAEAAAAVAAPGADSSTSARSACQASADAARSATTFYFANSGGRSYPVDWSDMTTPNPPIYKLATDVVISSGNSKELDGGGWKLIMSGGGVTQPTFTCS